MVTERLIQDKIFMFLQRKNEKKTNYDCISTNVKIYNWESDMLFTDRSDRVYEIEIKTSTGDYKADFKKTKKHNAIKHKVGAIPNYFYFVVPKKSKDKVNLPDEYGLIVYDQRLNFQTIKEARQLHKGKVEFRDKMKLVKSNYYKYWNERLKHETKIFNIRKN